MRATLQANAKNKNARVVISKNQSGRQSVDLKVLGNQVGKSSSKEEFKTSPEDNYISHQEQLTHEMIKRNKEMDEILKL